MAILDILLSCAIIICVGFIAFSKLYDCSANIPENLIGDLGTLIAMFCGAFYLYIRYPLPFQKFAFSKISVKNAIVWGGVGGLALILLNFPYAIVCYGVDIPKNLFVDPKHGSFFVTLFLISSIIFIPIIEEIFFRAFIFRIIKIEFSLFWGYFASTALFALGHHFQLPSIINSIVFCFIYEKTNYIGSSIFAHFLVNLVWHIAVYGTLWWGG